MTTMYNNTLYGRRAGLLADVDELSDLLLRQAAQLHAVDPPGIISIIMCIDMYVCIYIYI